MYGFSDCAVSNVVFVRMYTLLTLLMLSVIYVIILIIEESKFRWLCAAMLAILIFLIALTYYYGIIGSFIACAGMCAVLLCQKRIRQCFAYGGFAFVGALSALAFFPAMLKHVTGGYRGEAVLEKL